jgi:hypothetical protein
MALVSSWRRGYLPGFIALLALVVVTQIVTTIGAGALVSLRGASVVDVHRRRGRQPGVNDSLVGNAGHLLDVARRGNHPSAPGVPAPLHRLPPLRHPPPAELLGKMWQLEAVLFTLFSAQQTLVSRTRAGRR